jgi:hypothetical protein
MVDFYDLTVSLPQLEANGLADLVDVHKRAVRNGARHGTPLVMRTSGDARVNLFFRTEIYGICTAVDGARCPRADGKIRQS